MSLARVQHAESLYHAGQAAQAKAMLQRILQGSPNDAEANNLMALILQASQEPRKAVYFTERAYAANKGDARFANNLAMLYTRTGELAKARAVLESALRLHPSSLDLHLTLANTLSIDSDFVGSREACRAAHALAPGDSRASSILVSTLVEMGESKEAVRIARDALAHDPANIPLASQLCHAINYLPDVLPEDVLGVHTAFGDLLARSFPEPPPAFANAREPDRPLRVAIVSGDLRTHSVAYFIEPFLERHDRSAFQLFAYHTAVDDAVSARLKPFVHAWRGCAGIPDHVLAERIRADRVDVAIELSGHTCAATLLAFHRGVAPVQATYLGYPNTTGVRGMHWRIIDAVTDPAGSERWCVERLARLDPCFLCYRPYAGSPEVSLPPSAGGRPITFGSFNAVAKLSPEVMQLWARIVARVPGSRLVLKAASFLDARLRSEIAERLAAWGMPRGSLEILSPHLGIKEHLAAYSQVDIALDPSPYCGTTTTCEAMWMGVPVVTLRGETHSGRVGASLLGAVGLPELIADTPERYVEIASSLAGDASRLASMRAGMRERLRSSPLMDERGFSRRFESHIRAMWRSYCTPA